MRKLGRWYGFQFQVHKFILKIMRIDDTSVHKAVREVLVNYLVNTDYSGQNDVVLWAV